jgi:hypothetical protein
MYFTYFTVLLYFIDSQIFNNLTQLSVKLMKPTIEFCVVKILVIFKT